MAKYKVRSPYVDMDRQRRKKGDIVEVSKERGDRLVARRLVVPVDRQQPVETAAQKPTETTAARVTEPTHIGGGWYELPNGERVQGRETALERMKQL